MTLCWMEKMQRGALACLRSRRFAWAALVAAVAACFFVSHSPFTAGVHGSNAAGSTRKRRPGEIFRDEYKKPDFSVGWVELNIVLHEEETKVSSRVLYRRRSGAAPCDLVLDGEQLKLVSVKVDEAEIQANKQGGYEVLEDGRLRLPRHLLPESSDTSFILETTVVVNPKANLELRGLYLSNGTFVTQNEPQGFRRITYFLDRPDVMARYTVRLEADADTHPILLSNGNKLAAGPVESDPKRHYAVFEDPHPKPSYLFAVVAGKLSSIADTFTTMSGRVVDIVVHSEGTNTDKLRWALRSVKASMKWDEEKFGREYDLDVFHVVCVNDFNSGAMENKGLNIFNCNLLLADPKTTTDIEYEVIMGVVGHEYFHNWTGNRVTCRDWFQLTLKEGLTVFRDQMFSADVTSAAVKRIEDVTDVISRQFSEDSSAFAHPIRPDSYVAVENFYTSTVYRKGAEVVRMYHTILGPEGFRKGMDLYFARHDGQAVTCDDFRAAMADSSGVNFEQFERWYSQAGTPEVKVLEARYDRESQSFVLTMTQHTPPTLDQPHKLPVVIPVKLGLVGKESKRDILSPPTTVLLLTEEKQTFVVPNVREDCVPSVLRDFSAPVRLQFEQSLEDLAHLMAYDSDPVNKWRAAQALASSAILDRTRQATENPEVVFGPLPSAYIDAFRTALLDEAGDNSVKALILHLPSWSTLEQELNVVDPGALHRAMKSVVADIHSALKSELLLWYDKMSVPSGHPELINAEDVGRRRLRNVLLTYLSAPGDEEAAQRAFAQFSSASCMTDKYYALLALGKMQHELRELAMDMFYEDAKTDVLIMDKWFRAQGHTEVPNQVERVVELQSHPMFSFTNPNRFRSLMFIFTNFNKANFHRPDGKGYEVVADAVIKVDAHNRSVAAAMARPLMKWKHLEPRRRALVKQQLERILAHGTISANVREIVSKALEG